MRVARSSLTAWRFAAAAPLQTDVEKTVAVAVAVSFPLSVGLPLL